MPDSGGPVNYTYLCVTILLMFATGVGGFLAGAKGKSTRGDNHESRAVKTEPASPGRGWVVEQVGDRDTDGVPDLWSVFVGAEGTEERLYYGVTRRQEDNSIEGVTATLETIGLGFRAHDDTGDGKVDTLGFAIGHKPGATLWYNYQDFDFDGRIDQIAKIEDGGLVETHVRYGNKWMPAEKKDGPGRRLRVRAEDGREWLVRFSDGEWQASE